jgi:hypothetical protein
MIVFIVKKGIIARNHPWQERKDIIFRAKFGISPIGVINENFCSREMVSNIAREMDKS